MPAVAAIKAVNVSIEIPRPVDKPWPPLVPGTQAVPSRGEAAAENPGAVDTLLSNILLLPQVGHRQVSCR